MRYVALIRAINVGGRSMIAMPVLRELFESLGFKNVVTYIQTGNVLFTSSSASVTALEKKIEAKLSAHFGKPMRAFVLTAADLKKASRANGLKPAMTHATHHCQVMFLAGAPKAENVRTLMALEREPLRFHQRGRVFYYSYPRVVTGRMPTISFEKVLGVAGTTRTWKVIERLIELAQEPG